MFQLTTKDITVIAEVFYQEEDSRPQDGQNVFAYRISIMNDGQIPVKLLTRHWRIFDAGNGIRHVDGEGVVGQTPIIEPGSSFQYISGCQLIGDIGYMEGYYIMESCYDLSTFKVRIPRFQLQVPLVLN